MLAEIENVSHDDQTGFSASYLNESVGFWHFHPEIELTLNIKSYGTRIIGDNVELFDQYDMVLIAPNIPHCWNHYKGDRKLPENYGVALHFKPGSLGSEFLNQHEMQGVRMLFSEAERGIAFSVEDAGKAENHLIRMVSLKGIDKMIEFFNVMRILCNSEKRRPLCSENYKIDYDEHGNKKMTDVYTFIRENFQRPLTLKEAGKVAGMSPFAFSRFFKKNSGAGFVDYVNQVRTNKACFLLRETGDQIQDIALECGFASISNFNKQFRKSIGISPRDYRLQYNP